MLTNKATGSVQRDNQVAQRGGEGGRAHTTVRICWQSHYYIACYSSADIHSDTDVCGISCDRPVQYIGPPLVVIFALLFTIAHCSGSGFVSLQLATVAGF